MFPNISFLDLPAEIRLMIYVSTYEAFEAYVLNRGGSRSHRSVSGASVKVGQDRPDLSLLCSSKQVHAEASEVFFANADFSVIVERRPHHWFDMSKIWFQQDLTIPTSRIRKLTLTINVGTVDLAVQTWLQTRMSRRKNCLFFNQLTALRKLSIAVKISHWSFHDRQERQHLDHDEDLVVWLLKSIPSDVEIHWFVEPTELVGSRVDTSLSIARLRHLEEANAHHRGTSTSIPKEKRTELLEVAEPDFMAAWSEQQRQDRERRKRAQEQLREFEKEEEERLQLSKEVWKQQEEDRKEKQDNHKSGSLEGELSQAEDQAASASLV